MALRGTVGIGLRTLLVVSSLGVGLVGCGDDGGNNAGTTNVGGSTFVGSGGTTSGGGSGGTASSTKTAVSGTGGATVAATGTLVTNLPTTATKTFSSTVAGTGLTLRSLNVITDSATAYTEWFGEVVNNGASLVCYPQASFSFKNASGVVLWTDKAYAYTLPYLSASSTLSSSCLAAGEVGTFWSNDLSTIQPTSVAAVTVTFDGLVMTATKFSQTMTNSSVADAFYQDGNHWAMSGSLTPSQTIYNVGISVFTKATTGLLTGQLTDTNLGTITANTAWAFSSLTGIQGTKPASLLAYDDFILGSSTSGAGLTQVSELVKDPVAAGQHVAARSAKQAVADRRKLASAAN